MWIYFHTGLNRSAELLHKFCILGWGIMKIRYPKNEMFGWGSWEAGPEMRICIHAFIYGCKRALVEKLGTDTNGVGH